MEIELLHTLGCHLCEQAEQLVRQAWPRATLRRRDIAEDDALIERYGTLIPVVRCDGRELAWPFSLLDLRAAFQVR